MAAKVTFSGESKLIIVLSGVTEIDVQIDLYSAWKVWVTESDNSKYLQAFRTFGGDPTIAGQNAPRYFFLTNGWRIFIDNGEIVNVGLNLYTDEGTTAYIVGLGSGVSDRNSDAVVVNPQIAESLDYFGVVHINSAIGVTGTTYPIGTLAQPVSNVVDAKTIATNRGISDIRIYGTTIFNVDLENFIVYGGNITDVIVFQGVSVDNTTFEKCVLTGAYNGYIVAEVCQLMPGLTGLNGTFKDCALAGTLYASTGASINILNCSSVVPGIGYPAVVLSSGVNTLSLRKYSGGFGLDGANSSTTVTMEFLAGRCYINSGCTGGTIIVRGIAGLVDSSSGATVNDDNLIQPQKFDVLPDQMVATQHSVNTLTEIVKYKP